jgi:hypothetical protein
MCNKFMFLIFAVALLGLVNIVSADEWGGGCIGPLSLLGVTLLSRALLAAPTFVALRGTLVRPRA